MILDREEFLDVVTPEQRQFITDCIKRGLADYDNPDLYGEAARRVHTPSIRATIRNCHIVSHAKRGLLERSDIKVREKRNRVLFIISDKICVSFKKFDDNLRTRNYPTQQALAFEGQTLHMDLPSEVTNIFAGYLFNQAETEYELFITCPVGKKNEWHLKLSGSAKVLDLFSTNREMSNGEVKVVEEVVEKVQKRRVRIRSEAMRKDTANE
jgi:hypothetical protein